jgi:hypothetical protein
MAITCRRGDLSGYLCNLIAKDVLLNALMKVFIEEDNSTNT